MKIAVFGANGRVGSKVVAKLLANGDEVQAFVHNSSPFTPHPKLEMIQGDIHDKEAVARALQGCGGVISALGSWGTPTKDIQVSGMKSIIPAMQTHGIDRIVSITGAGAFDKNDQPSVVDKLSRFAISHLAAKVFRDGEQHIALLRKSKLEWTVLRSSIMKEKGAPGHFKLDQNFPSPWATILRDDVATALVTLTHNKDYIQQAPFIHRS